MGDTMSSKFLFRALQYRADSPVKKLLLIKLGDVSDDNGQSFYSYQSLGEVCCLGRSTVKKHLKELEEQGLLKIENRAGPNGNSSNLYTLNIPATDWEKEKYPVSPNNTGVSGDNTGGVAGDSPESKNSFESKKETISYVEQARQCLEYLNRKSNSNYKTTTKSHIENISARLRGGATTADVMMVIDSKVAEWGNNPSMVQYLRPDTLFSLKKFDGYLAKARLEQTAKPSLQQPQNNHQTRNFTL
jgi:uncharacterized phage protein (TIGR02220 family)